MSQRKLSNSFAALLFLAILFPAFQASAATVKGRVWLDNNTNGIQDPGDSGMSNVWVQIEAPDGAMINGMYSGGDGGFAFTGVSGTYRLKFANPGNYYQTRLNMGNDDSVDNDADLFGYTDFFTATGNQTVTMDGGFSAKAFGCFTPITVTITNKLCNNNGTPNNPNDDTWTFQLTATGGTGPWGWDLPSQGILMFPYGQARTFGPYSVTTSATVNFTIIDHDNTDCTASVSVTAPACPPSPPPPSTLSIVCPSGVTVTAQVGQNTAIVTFSNATATTTCPTGGVVVTQTSGPASGTAFPVGTTQVCFRAVDNCGNQQTCCISIMVNAPPPPPSGILSMTCPADQSMFTDPASTNGTLNFNPPVATSTCPVGTVTVTQISGPANGTKVGVGMHTIVFRATDGCNNTKTCSFKITVKEVCEEHTIGGIIFELLDIEADAKHNKTYCMRVTNTTANELVYVAFGLPDGVTAKSPANNSMYTAPSGRQYNVRNPNFAPFYSIRFKTKDGVPGIKSGQSDIFKYVLGPQANPWAIHVVARTAPKNFFEWYLHTFDCMPPLKPNGPSTASTEAAIYEGESQIERNELLDDEAFAVYPNPAYDMLFVNLSAWTGSPVRVQVLDAQGRLIRDLNTVGSAEPLQIEMNNLAGGIYHVQAVPAVGSPESRRVVVKR